MGAIWRPMLRFLTPVLDYLLPPTCLACDEAVTEQGRLCAACFGRMPAIVAPFCDRCGTPFASAVAVDARFTCRNCVETPPVWRRAVAPFRYDALAREMALQLKHADRIDLAPWLAEQMARAGRAADMFDHAAIIAPVPLHRRRLFGRKYNQSALLARYIASEAGLIFAPDVLLRVRPTPKLGGRTAAERRETVSGAFAVNPGRADWLKDRPVILIDDVLTSGATANECCRALRAAGAATIDVLAAARVCFDH